MDAKRNSLIALVLLVLLFFGVNIVADAALRSVRIDLTENRLYTLSDGTRQILGELDEPITLTLFFSEALSRGRPQIQSYGRRVQEVLEEYRLLSGGMITVNVLDPEPFSEAEERAQREGIPGIPVAAGESLFLGLLATNSTDGREIIPVLDPTQERFLEYELSRVLFKLTNVERARVGVITALPLDGETVPSGLPQEYTRPWQIMRELRELFDVELLPFGSTSIDPELDLLLLMHPKNLSEATLRAIDAHVITGGAMIVVIDPMCERDIPAEAAQNPMAIMNAQRSSDLQPLLGAWGLTMTPDRVVADMDNAVQGTARDGTRLSYVQYLAIGEDGLNQDDPVTARVSTIQLASVGRLEHLEGAGTAWTPLIESSAQSMLIDASKLGFLVDQAALVANFLPSEQRYTMAGRLSGPARSAYNEGTETDAINVLVIADVDMFYDALWVSEVRLGNQLLGYQKRSDNADLLAAAIDNMAGSSALTLLRARGTTSRPFTRVEEIRRDAEREFLSEAQALEDQRRQVEQRLSQLQRARPDQGELILTPEQQAEIELFRGQLAETNAQLRDVRYSLRKDVEQLGVTLKVLNIGVAPAVVALGAIGLGAFRVMRRRGDRVSGASPDVKEAS
ncbi:MAG: Gldg family protein [Planctomycetota bacterium]